MKRLRHTITLGIVTLCSIPLMFAQGTISGKIVDENQEALVGATVILKGTARGALTDFEGRFTMEAEAGSYTLVTSFIGYVQSERIVDVQNGEKTDLGTLGLQSEAVGLDEVEIIASVAIDRKTPVAVSTISGKEIEELVGNQEFPEVLKNTPSVYVTKQGGGVGDSRINVRGFDQRNTAVMINGIPVNDMENGWVYWSNWAGLSDVTSTMQIQRGLGASKLAVSSVGGSINIVTNAADFRKGGAFKVSIGNDGYQKYSAVLSSGLMDNGWAITAQYTHTRGDGYIQGTDFRAHSYFVSLTKQFNNKHSISITGLGAPQWHNQRTVSSFDGITLQTYQDRGLKYNHLHGTLNGESFSWRKNFYHKPKFFVNHYWNISQKTNVKTSAYASYGRGGGTGPRGRINSPTNGRLFDSSPLTRNGDGSVRWDDLVRYNQGQAIEPELWGVKAADTEGPFAGQYTSTSSGSGFIRRASMNSHNWYGVLSTLTHELNDKLTLITGVDGRYYKGIHYRRLENLLGLDAYKSRADDNNPNNYITEASPADFGNFSDNSYKDGNNVLNYWNDGLVSWIGLFGQVEYSTGPLTIFASASGSNQGFKRIDYFNYLENDENRETDWQNFLGGTVKAGANYNLNSVMNVYVNGGYFSQQPIFDNVFINFRNDINPDIENREVYAVEAGYGIRSGKFSANLNLYSTLWTNRQFDKTLTIQSGNEEVTGLAIFSGVGQLHQGIEIDLIWRPVHAFTLKGMVSLNSWEYSDNFDAAITDVDNNQSLGTATVFADGLKVGDAAQTTFSLFGQYRFNGGFSLYANYYFADNLYADFDIEDSAFLQEGAEVVKLPNYALVDAGASWRFPLGPVEGIVSTNINNVFDTEYIAELDTNIPGEANLLQNRGWYGFGRTWNASFRIRF